MPILGFAATRPRAVVAIPVRDEAERIAGCLRALSAQDAGDFGVVLLLNNCRDATAGVAASLAPALPFPIRLIEREFSDATAGWARREAMDAAAGWLDEGIGAAGVILTTDADSRVPPNWISGNLAVLAAGADAVAGRFVLDAGEATRLPAALHARGRLEGAYEALLVELESLVDPIVHDPWPRHWTTSGASLAVTVEAYRRVGGMPPLAVGEDRAFVSSLLSSDARVRHDPSIVVITSGRLDGRAAGGAADTMRRRCEEPDSPCDPRLEPLPRALFRFGWRRRLRRLHARRRLTRLGLWAPWLGIAPAAARAVAACPSAGAAVAAAEAASPLLAHRPLRPAELPLHIRLATAALTCLRAEGRCRTAIRMLSRAPVRASRLQAERARV